VIELLLFSFVSSTGFASDERRRTETDGGHSSFASEQELQELASEWPMKRLVEIWNRLPGVERVTRFTDRKTAIARIWRALQPQTDKPGVKAARRDSRSRHRPVFREGSKAAQVCTLLSRPQGATLNEIRSETGWQAHTVRGFISRNLSKQGRNVRSFEREGERMGRTQPRREALSAGLAKIHGLICLSVRSESVPQAELRADQKRR
jgi:hypothetical protein